MLETTDNLIQENYNSITNNMYWQPNTINVYEECLKTFFPDGILFNGNILYSSKILPNATPSEDYTIYTSLGNTEEKLGIKVAFTLRLKTESGCVIRFYFKDDEYNEFKFDPDNGFISIPDELEIIEHYEYNYDTNEIYIICTPEILDENGYKIILNENFAQKDFLILNEFIYKQNNLVFLKKGLPQMDSADLCAFLWYANKGKILRNKIFSGKSLIENKFSEIDFVKQINFNEHIEDDIYQNLLKNTLPGDIYVFEQSNTYHCIFIIDPIKHYYTECSSKIEYELNPFYNGKINPYNFERRIKSLSENSNLYHVRLN